MSVGKFFGQESAVWVNNPPLEIPIPLPISPFFSITTILDGKSYGLTFKYSAREDRWYLTIRDVSDVLLVGSIKIVGNWPLLRRSQYIPGIPNGGLVAADFSPQGGASPGYNDLGTRVRILYYPTIVTP